MTCYLLTLSAIFLSILFYAKYVLNLSHWYILYILIRMSLLCRYYILCTFFPLDIILNFKKNTCTIQVYYMQFIKFSLRCVHKLFYSIFIYDYYTFFLFFYENEKLDDWWHPQRKYKRPEYIFRKPRRQPRGKIFEYN